MQRNRDVQGWQPRREWITPPHGPRARYTNFQGERWTVRPEVANSNRYRLFIGDARTTTCGSGLHYVMAIAENLMTQRENAK